MGRPRVRRNSERVLLKKLDCEKELRPLFHTGRKQHVRVEKDPHGSLGRWEDWAEGLFIARELGDAIFRVEFDRLAGNGPQQQSVACRLDK